MIQNYSQASDAQIEALEKQSLRMIVQALQEYSKEARLIFENTAAPSDNEVIVLAEDLVQYALEVAECYPINKRFAGFIDYKRVRWVPTSFGLFPQVLLVDAKASTERNRETLQRSQLPLDADFAVGGKVEHMPAGVPPHMDLETISGATLPAITTSAFVHFYYEKLSANTAPYRRLKAIFALSIPHQRLKHIYNPSPLKSFFGAGKHSPKRGEVPRVRVYFDPLRAMCAWRLQELAYVPGQPYTTPAWRDIDPANGKETVSSFEFLAR